MKCGTFLHLRAGLLWLLLLVVNRRFVVSAQETTPIGKQKPSSSEKRSIRLRGLDEEEELPVPTRIPKPTSNNNVNDQIVYTTEKFSNDDESKQQQPTTPPVTPSDERITGYASVSIIQAAQEYIPPTKPPRAPNDFCEDAIPIEPLQDEDQQLLIIASASRAKSVNITSCGSNFGDDYSAKGLFYTILGTGKGLTVDYQAEFEMFLSVYSASSDGGCGNLTCVTGTGPLGYDWSSAEETGGLPTTNGTLSWATKLGEKYYLYAHSGFSEASQFEMTISTPTEEMPVNRNCSTAIPIEIGQSINGTTTFGEIRPYICDELFGTHPSPTTAPGLWYSILGTGEAVLFTVSSNYDSVVVLYTGDTCDEVTCISGNDFSFVPSADSSIVDFLEEGVTYYIFVMGFNKFYGDFSLSVESVEQPENDLCSSATTLQVGGVLETGSNILSTDGVGDLIPPCGTNSSSPGVWYNLTGTGSVIEVILQPSILGNPLVSSVYTGESCDTLTCLRAGTEEFSTIFQSNLGQQYLIYVFGTSQNDRNDFNITAEELEPPTNDQCQVATVLEINGPPLLGDTTASTPEKDLEICGEIESLGYGGVWFAFVGTGEPLVLGVNTSFASFFDAQLSLYSGSANCKDMVCLDGIDDNLYHQGRGYSSALDIYSVDGMLYHALVHGYERSRGMFEIELRSFTPAENTNCTSALEIELGDLVDGSTYFLNNTQNSSDFSCGITTGSNLAPGIWYKIIGGGTGRTMEASIVSSEYRAHISVLFGDSCDPLICVGGSYRWMDASLIWDSWNGTDYYIFVHGNAANEVGDFVLSVNEIERPANNWCDGAIELTEIGGPLSESTRYATVEAIGDCFSSVSSSNSSRQPFLSQIVASADETNLPSLWYKLTTEDMTTEAEFQYGDSGYFVQVANFTDSHRLAVFVGDSCSDLACIANATGEGASGALLLWDRLSEDSETYYIVLQSYEDFGSSQFDITWGDWGV